MVGNDADLVFFLLRRDKIRRQKPGIPEDAMYLLAHEVRQLFSGDLTAQRFHDERPDRCMIRILIVIHESRSPKVHGHVPESVFLSAHIVDMHVSPVNDPVKKTAHRRHFRGSELLPFGLISETAQDILVQKIPEI